MNSWEDNVLLKLKREYSKDETVAALTKKLSETEILLGMRNDEISELKEEISELNDNKKIKNKINNIHDGYKSQISSLKRQIETLSKKVEGQKEFIKNQESTIYTLKYDSDNDGTTIKLKKERDKYYEIMRQYTRVTGINQVKIMTMNPRLVDVDKLKKFKL